MLDGLLPHSHELPSFEFLEERKLLDVVVRVSLNQPLSKTDKFYWIVIFIIGEAFATESVIFVWATLKV